MYQLLELFRKNINKTFLPPAVEPRLVVWRPSCLGSLKVVILNKALPILPQPRWYLGRKRCVFWRLEKDRKEKCFWSIEKWNPVENGDHFCEILAFMRVTVTYCNWELEHCVFAVKQQVDFFVPGPTKSDITLFHWWESASMIGGSAGKQHSSHSRPHPHFQGKKIQEK